MEREPRPLDLPLRQRLSWFAHLFKALFRQHHTGMLDVLTALIPADAVVLDVGAHAGQFTKLFAGLAPRGRVYAFEPSRYARSILHYVLVWHRLRHVEVVAAALADAPGGADLVTPIKASGALGFGLAHLGAAAGRSARHDRVEVSTLDAFAAARGLARIDFIKADIQGSEIRLLRGGAEALARYRPAVLLEIAADDLQRSRSDAAEAWQRFDDLAYRAFRWNPLADRPLWPAPAPAGDGDYLFADAAILPLLAPFIADGIARPPEA
jgi:FkbM family methyltransferase